MAAFLPQLGSWCYFWHLWNCCMPFFFPLAPTRDQKKEEEELYCIFAQYTNKCHWDVLNSKDFIPSPSISLFLFSLPDSPCYSTEQQPCQHVPVNWSGNSPQRSRSHQVCHPGGEWIQLHCLCVSCVLRRYECLGPVDKCLYIWCAAVESGGAYRI